MKNKALLIMVMALMLTCDLAWANSAGDALTERERAIHVLNRLAYGPRPGDVDRILEIGVDRWIEQQLHPGSIDDGVVEASLASLETLTMSSEELFETYQRPVLEARMEMRRRAGEPEDRSEEIERMRSMRGDDPRRPVTELTIARITRATISERQLHEVMVDFWMNHFNVFAGKPPTGVFLTEYEYETIRPNIWGSFEDLLLATAKSPAMLVYLDNMRSVAEANNRPSRDRRPISIRGGRESGMKGAVGRRGRSDQRRAAARLEQAGLNENYARELMELHTLGVDGGYAQDDVVSLARILTGWSIRRPEEGIGFIFRNDLHDARAKSFLGTEFRAGGGIEEGERAIRLIARHPSTAKRIATKLVSHLVADEPPGSLVERVAARFTETGGDLRETVRTIVTSPEFFDRSNYRSKTKTPFEFVASSLRATQAEAEPRFLSLQLRELGQPLYFCQPPTGYSDKAEDWISGAQLMSRMNFATALTAGRVATITSVGDDASEAAAIVIGESLSPSTTETIEKQIAEADPESRSRVLTGLILGSPEFQKQ